MRLVTGGVEVTAGATLRARAARLDRLAKPWRGALLSEPRGHGDTTVAVLTEADRPDAHAGVLFLRRHSSPPYSGHALMAVAALATGRGLITTASEPPGRLVLETLAGPAEIRVGHGSPAEGAASVCCGSIPARVIAGGVEVVIDGRRVLVDVTGSDAGLLVLVDAESAGAGLGEATRPVLQRAAAGLIRAVSSRVVPARRVRVGVGPREGASAGLAAPGGATNPARRVVSGVVFTSPDESGLADLRTCTVWGDGTMDRSPSGRAAAGLVALLDELGLVPEDRALVLRGPAGGTFEARVVSRDTVGAATWRQAGEALEPGPAEGRAVRVEVSGTVWPTGYHTFVMDPADPLSGVSAAER